MRHLRWFRASTTGAPFIYIETYSCQAARDEARKQHHLYRSAKWIEVKACGYQEAMQHLRKGEK